MTYTVPPKKPDPKQRFIVVTDPDEIASIRRNGLREIIGAEINGQWYAESHSLSQWRKGKVEFNV